MFILTPLGLNFDCIFSHLFHFFFFLNCQNKLYARAYVRKPSYAPDVCAYASMCVSKCVCPCVCACVCVCDWCFKSLPTLLNIVTSIFPCKCLDSSVEVCNGWSASVLG